MPSTRLIRSLSSFPSSSAPRASTSLAPPYAHEAPAPGPSLVPPYSHTVKPPSSSTSLSPHHRFSLRQRTTTPPALSTALRSLLSTPDGRRRLTELWVQSIDGIERTRSTGVQIPQVSFITLGQHLGDESFVQTIKETGVVVVRDVVRDEDVAGWAKQLGKALEERQGRCKSTLIFTCPGFSVQGCVCAAQERLIADTFPSDLLGQVAPRRSVRPIHPVVQQPDPVCAHWGRRRGVYPRFSR